MARSTQHADYVDGTGVQVLGVGSVIFIIFYVLGMAYKLFKIWRGEYVEEEPVFLKYK